MVDDESTMKLIDAFESEHALIDRVLGSLRCYVGRVTEGGAAADDGGRFARFFAEFVGRYHSQREERILFEALVTQADLPRERGPVQALTREHAEMEAWLGEMTPLLERGPRNDPERARLRTLAADYSRALWRHIDAENSVLYVEGAQRLARNGIRELADRPITEAEAAARDDAQALLQRYPPVEDATLARGDGCFMCRVHGDGCDGLEAEWWSDLEWDEFHER